MDRCLICCPDVAYAASLQLQMVVGAGQRHPQHSQALSQVSCLLLPCAHEQEAGLQAHCSVISCNYLT